MKIILDGQYLKNRESAHLYLKEMLGFPDYYGSNLDALYDELTSVATATTVEIHNAGEDDCTKMILRVFQDAEEENEYLDIVLAVN